MNLYLLENKEQTGPFTLAELQQKISDGLPTSTLAWKEGFAEWRPLSEFLLPAPPVESNISDSPDNKTEEEVSTKDQVLGCLILTVLSIIGIAVVVLFYKGCSGSPEASNTPAALNTSATPQSVSAAQAIYEASSTDDAIAAAKDFLVGTWTYTGQEHTRLGMTQWHKWVIKEDGTMLIYSASPMDDDWGEPGQTGWEITTGKYSNTGERYFGFHKKGSEIISDIRPDGTIGNRNWMNVTHGGGKPSYEHLNLDMTRGDTSPLSN